MLLSLMPFEETGKTRVRTNCLNFDVSLCIRILKKIQLEEEGIGLIFCGILDPAAFQFVQNFVV